MKKMLTLVLVLAVASIASAALTDGDIYVGGVSTSSVTINTGQNLTIQIYSGNLNSYLAYAVVEDTGTQVGALSDYSKLAAAGNQGGGVAYDEAGWGYGFELTTGAANPVAGEEVVAGIQHTMVFSSAVEGTAVIGLFEGNGPYDFGQELAALTVTVVPEPVTMALLGLGGLFLRRKKA